MVAHRSVIVIAAAAPIIGVRVPVVWLGQRSARDPLMLFCRVLGRHQHPAQSPPPFSCHCHNEQIKIELNNGCDFILFNSDLVTSEITLN